MPKITDFSPFKGREAEQQDLAAGLPGGGAQLMEILLAREKLAGMQEERKRGAERHEEYKQWRQARQGGLSTPGAGATPGEMPLGEYYESARAALGERGAKVATDLERQKREAAEFDRNKTRIAAMAQNWWRTTGVASLEGMEPEDVAMLKQDIVQLVSDMQAATQQKEMDAIAETIDNIKGQVKDHRKRYRRVQAWIGTLEEEIKKAEESNDPRVAALEDLLSDLEDDPDMPRHEYSRRLQAARAGEVYDDVLPIGYEPPAQLPPEMQVAIEALGTGEITTENVKAALKKADLPFNVANANALREAAGG
jgi:hypothetical protein